MTILTVNLLLSTLGFWIAGRLYLLPRLHEWKPRTVLLPILLLHSFRHLGLMFLAPGATYTGIPPQFACPAALGDLLASLLAFTAIQALEAELKRAAVPTLIDRHAPHRWGAARAVGDPPVARVVKSNARVRKVGQSRVKSCFRRLQCPRSHPLFIGSPR
jgi:hypothetical protein